MKKKLLLILLFHLVLGSSVCAKNLFENEILSNFNLDFCPEISTFDSIKKIKNFKKVSKFLAVLPPPITTAGSACGDGSSLVQVNVSAFGANGTETIEWFTSQVSSAPIYTGSIYSPSISTTKTYYVRSRSGNDLSTRVPVVASIYVAPPAVTLTASPPNNTTSPLCYGTSVTFTASGGADLFEFSIDGVVMQTMSTSRVFTTNTLTDGQVVKVRTRYAVIMDGSITETAWGTGSLEDNVLSSPLSPSAINGYVNAFKISALEDKVVIGVAGKIVNNRSILFFLDTKAGGFNISNYGDESTVDPLTRAFNIFNNSPSTFDSYFLADYCLIISTDAAETNYYANIIELRTGNSIKTFIGSAATGFPSAVIGVNKNNSGIADYNLGFEVQLLKSLIGYTNGDIKFFAFTMNDGQEGSQSVTNSFLSPERSSNLDYGIAAVDYNFKDPNPVVVASAALTPCYSETNITMNFVSVPITASVVQPTCAITTGIIRIESQTGVEYSLDGVVYQNSEIFFGLTPGNYTLYVRNKLDTTCVLLSTTPVTINSIPTPPAAPTPTSVVQPTCAVPSGSITVTTQSGVAYSLNGTTYQISNVFNGLAPGNYTLYVRNTADNTCSTASNSTITINTVPTLPVAPTATSVVQPTCAFPSGSITITTQSGVAYSLNGTVYQTSNVFTGLAPGNYTMYVRNIADTTCVTTSTVNITINAIPISPAAPIVASVVQPTCAVPSGSISITTQSGVLYSLNGTSYQTSNVFTGLASGSYTLYVRSTTDTTCVTTSTINTTINAVPSPPAVPTTANVVQPTCTFLSGSITVTSQSGVLYSLNGSTYQTSNVFTGLAPGSYTLYVRNITDTTCVSLSTANTTINQLPVLPSTPTVTTVVQPTCAVPFGSITITSQPNVQYSIGNGYQNSTIFNSVPPGKYIISVHFTNSIACITEGSEVTITSIPAQIQFETTGECDNNQYIVTANPLMGSYDPNAVSYQWRDNTGTPIGTNSNILNVSNAIASRPNGQFVFPAAFTLMVTATNTGCLTTSNVVIESAYCNIQKGISPDGNGSNDFFDLRMMNVKNLEVFNRYGIKVYNQVNYTNQWKGQSNTGDDLPGATYYYVIEFNSGESKTGWIYLIREK